MTPFHEKSLLKAARLCSFLVWRPPTSFDSLVVGCFRADTQRRILRLIRQDYGCMSQRSAGCSASAALDAIPQFEQTNRISKANESYLLDPLITPVCGDADMNADMDSL